MLRAPGTEVIRLRPALERGWSSSCAPGDASELKDARSEQILELAAAGRRMSRSLSGRSMSRSFTGWSMSRRFSRSLSRSFTGGRMSRRSANRRRARQDVRARVVVEKLRNRDQVLITFHHSMISPGRAASIAARISRTAAGSPTKTDLLTIEWPMFNSSIAEMAATGATLPTVRP